MTCLRKFLLQLIILTKFVNTISFIKRDYLVMWSRLTKKGVKCQSILISLDRHILERHIYKYIIFDIAVYV